MSKTEVSTAYLNGWHAFYAEMSYLDCPYSTEHKEKINAWTLGWFDAEEDSLGVPTYEQGT